MSADDLRGCDYDDEWSRYFSPVPEVEMDGDA